MQYSTADRCERHRLLCPGYHHAPLFCHCPLVSALLVGFLAACGSDSPVEPAQSPFVSATVNGAPWRANFQVELAVADLMNQGRVLEVVGLQLNGDGSTQQVAAQITDYRGPGTYSLGDPATASGFGYYVTRASQAAASVSYATDGQNTGSITISALDMQTRRVSGTFSFRARQVDAAATVTIDSGKFAGRVVIE